MSPESKLALERWKQGKIAKLGIDGFQDYSDRMLARGHLLHERIAHYLLHDDLPNIEESGHSKDDEISDNHMKSITPVLEHFSKPLALESRVVHPELKYQGEIIIYLNFAFSYTFTLFNFTSLFFFIPQVTQTVLPCTRRRTSV